MQLRIAAARKPGETIVVRQPANQRDNIVRQVGVLIDFPPSNALRTTSDDDPKVVSGDGWPGDIPKRALQLRIRQDPARNLDVGLAGIESGQLTEQAPQCAPAFLQVLDVTG